MRVAGLVIGVALLVGASCADGQAATPLPRLLTEDGGKTFAIRPPHIVVSGDGAALIAGNAAWIGRNPTPHQLGSQFGRIEWLAWKANSANGIATFWLDNCKPDCAQGTYLPTSGIIAASDVHDGRFARLAFVGGMKKYLFSLLRIAGSGYVWNLHTTKATRT
jgi:hypothetical protein